MISKSNDTITIKNKCPVEFVIIPAIMAALGIYLIIGLLPFENDQPQFFDIFGLVFVCLWIAIVVTIAVCFISACHKTIILNNDGVLCKQIFSQKFYDWNELQDFGLSYCGNQRGGTNIYCLYFSKEYLEQQNKFKKRLKGQMIKVLFMGYEYNEIVRSVIPFCKRKTAIEPFVAPDEQHF